MKALVRKEFGPVRKPHHNEHGNDEAETNPIEPDRANVDRGADKVYEFSEHRQKFVDKEFGSEWGERNRECSSSQVFPGAVFGISGRSAQCWPFQVFFDRGRPQGSERFDDSVAIHQLDSYAGLLDT